METIIKDKSEIKRLIKMGIVIPCNQTFEKIKPLYGGKSFTCYYVDDVIRTRVRNIEYFAKYVDGCFYPYVAMRRIETT